MKQICDLRNPSFAVVCIDSGVVKRGNFPHLGWARLRLSESRLKMPAGVRSELDRQKRRRCT